MRELPEGGGAAVNTDPGRESEGSTGNLLHDWREARVQRLEQLSTEEIDSLLEETITTGSMNGLSNEAAEILAAFVISGPRFSGMPESVRQIAWIYQALSREGQKTVLSEIFFSRIADFLESQGSSALPRWIECYADAQEKREIRDISAVFQHEGMKECDADLLAQEWHFGLLNRRGAQLLKVNLHYLARFCPTFEEIEPNLIYISDFCDAVPALTGEAGPDFDEEIKLAEPVHLSESDVVHYLADQSTGGNATDLSALAKYRIEAHMECCEACASEVTVGA